MRIIKKTALFLLVPAFFAGCGRCGDAPKAITSSAAVKADEAAGAGSKGKTQHFSVEAVSPSEKDKNAENDSQVRITFTKQIDKKSLAKNMIIASTGGEKLEGDISVSGQTALFKSASLFQRGGQYIGIIRKGTKSAEGDELQKDYKWKFEISAGKLPKIRVLNGDSIILSDVAGYDFFDQDLNILSEPAVFTVKNEGVVDLVLQNIRFIAGDTSQFSLMGPKLPVTLPPKGSIQFMAQFKPAAPGKKIVKVSIKSSDEVFGNFNFLMTGKGI